MHKGIDPGRPSTAERLAEIAEILAAGLIRLKTRQSTSISRDCGDSSLDFSPDPRMHAAAPDRARTMYE